MKKPSIRNLNGIFGFEFVVGEPGFKPGTVTAWNRVTDTVLRSESVEALLMLNILNELRILNASLKK